MNAARPEAETEYSSGPPALSGPRRGPTAALGLAVPGAVALLIAEFTPLLRITTVARHPVLVRTVQSGPHHGWALVPIALLAVLLAGLGRRSRRALPALALLGLAALGIALLVDLPDVGARGIVGSSATGIHPAQARAGLGLYLETLGAALLLLGSAAGALF